MKLFSLTLFSLLAAAAYAQPATALSLTDALARAAQSNPRLLAGGSDERAASALQEQAAARPNPVLGFTLENFAGTGTARGIDSLEATVELSQTIERAGKRAKRTAVASSDREIATRTLAVQRRELLAGTARAYVDTVVAQQSLALAAEPLKLAQETLAATEFRISTGAASPAESARARALLASAQAEVARGEAALALARTALAASWGDATEATLEVAGKIHVPATLPDPAPFLAELTTHPTLALHTALIAREEASLALEQANATQDISVAGGVRFLRENSDAALVAGVAVPLPLRHKNQGNIRAARELLAGRTQLARAVENELRAAFSTAWQELAAAHHALSLLRRDAWPATEEAATATRHAYQQGELPLVDLLDAQRALVALRREILDHETAYAHALVRVEALTNSSFTATSALLATP